MRAHATTCMLKHENRLTHAHQHTHRTPSNTTLDVKKTNGTQPKAKTNTPHAQTSNRNITPRGVLLLVPVLSTWAILLFFLVLASGAPARTRFRGFHDIPISVTPKCVPESVLRNRPEKVKANSWPSLFPACFDKAKSDRKCVPLFGLVLGKKTCGHENKNTMTDHFGKPLSTCSQHVFREIPLSTVHNPPASCQQHARFYDSQPSST